MRVLVIVFGVGMAIVASLSAQAVAAGDPTDNAMLLQVGVGGMFALLVIREVRGILRERSERDTGNGTAIKSVDWLLRQIQDIVNREVAPAITASREANANIDETRHALAGPLNVIQVQLAKDRH